mgnify:CR=1 FL=1
MVVAVVEGVAVEVPALEAVTTGPLPAPAVEVTVEAMGDLAPMVEDLPTAAVEEEEAMVGGKRFYRRRSGSLCSPPSPTMPSKPMLPLSPFISFPLKN